jgi:hypothetical protein
MNITNKAQEFLGFICYIPGGGNGCFGVLPAEPAPDRHQNPPLVGLQYQSGPPSSALRLMLPDPSLYTGSGVTSSTLPLGIGRGSIFGPVPSFFGGSTFLGSTFGVAGGSTFLGSTFGVAGTGDDFSDRLKSLLFILTRLKLVLSKSEAGTNVLANNNIASVISFFISV